MGRTDKQLYYPLLPRSEWEETVITQVADEMVFKAHFIYVNGLTVLNSFHNK